VQLLRYFGDCNGVTRWSVVVTDGYYGVFNAKVFWVVARELLGC